MVKVARDLRRGPFTSRRAFTLRPVRAPPPTRRSVSFAVAHAQTRCQSGQAGEDHDERHALTIGAALTRLRDMAESHLIGELRVISSLS